MTMMYQPVHTLRIYINFMSKFIVKTDIFARETTLCTRFVAIRSGLVKVQNQMKQTSLNEITFTKFNQLQLKPLPKNNTCFCVCFDVCNVIILIFPVWPFSMLNNNCQFDELLFFFTLNCSWQWFWFKFFKIIHQYLRHYKRNNILRISHRSLAQWQIHASWQLHWMWKKQYKK